MLRRVRLATWVTAGALAVAGLALVGTCGEAAPPVQIAVPNPGLADDLPVTFSLAQQVVDSTARPGERGIQLILQPTAEPGIEERPEDGTMVRLLDRAARFSAMPGVVAVVGPTGSGDALLGAPIYAGTLFNMI